VGLSKDGKEDYIRAYNEYCLEKTCHFLRGGRLYVCPCIPMAYEQQEFLGLSISEDELMDSSIDIFHVKSGWEILDKVSNPVPLCRLCTEPRLTTWETTDGKPKREDFFV
jgi:hypothetical protein